MLEDDKKYGSDVALDSATEGAFVGAMTLWVHINMHLRVDF